MNGDTIAAIFLGALAVTGWVAYLRASRDLRLTHEARLRERADARKQLANLQMKYDDAMSTNIVLSTKLIKWKRELR